MYVDESELFFRGTYIMRYLADRLLRATMALLSVNPADIDSDIKKDVYEAYLLHPLEMHEDQIKIRFTTGYRDKNPFLTRPAKEDSPYAIKCRVTEFMVPFDGDRHLFGLTTGPMPFYPYGKVDGDNFIISVKDGEEHFLNDPGYQLSLLRMCLKASKAAVECYNEELRKMIYGEQDDGVPKDIPVIDVQT